MLEPFWEIGCVSEAWLRAALPLSPRHLAQRSCFLSLSRAAFGRLFGVWCCARSCLLTDLTPTSRGAAAPCGRVGGPLRTAEAACRGPATAAAQGLCPLPPPDSARVSESPARRRRSAGREGCGQDGEILLCPLLEFVVGAVKTTLGVCGYRNELRCHFTCSRRVGFSGCVPTEWVTGQVAGLKSLGGASEKHNPDRNPRNMTVRVKLS